MGRKSSFAKEETGKIVAGYLNGDSLRDLSYLFDRPYHTLRDLLIKENAYRFRNSTRYTTESKQPLTDKGAPSLGI